MWPSKVPGISTAARDAEASGEGLALAMTHFEIAISERQQTIYNIG